MKSSFLHRFLRSIFLLVLANADRISKRWAVSELGDTVINWNGILRFKLAINQGLSWSLFSSSHDWVRWLFVGIGLCMLVAIVVHGYSDERRGRPIWAEQFLIIGGISNIVDRIQYGGVIDFINLFVGQYQWPTTFNLADLFILAGIALLLSKVIKYGNDDRKN